MVAQRDAGEAATLARVGEAEIGPDLRPQVQALLQSCFPGYPSRTYFKLPLISAIWPRHRGPWWGRWAWNSG